MRESDGNGWRSHNVGERAPLLAGETINTINTCTDTSSSTSSTTAAAASDFQTTPWRWYMLIGLSLLGALQSGIWNTFGPINDAVKPVYGWEHDWMVALIANWGPICYLIAVLPSSWVLDTHGLRAACLGSATLMFAGSALRCFTTRHVVGTALVHAGQILNGLAGPVASASAPLLSSLWFPPRERTTATSIVAISMYLGVAVSFIAGPKLVPVYEGEDNSHLTPAILHRRSHDILVYMWGQTALAGLCLGLLVMHFPNRPDNHPSRSASKERTEFWTGLRQLFRHRAFLTLSLAYGIITGVYSGWGSFLSPNLEHFIHPQSRADDLSGWLGFWATVAGCGAGLLVGFLADCLGGRVKALLLVLTTGAIGACLWLSLACDGVTANSTAILYAACILGGCFINGTIPLFYEMGCEVTFPISEGSATCVLTSFNQVGALIFLFLPFDTHLGSSWANWTLLGACVASALLILGFSERYLRTRVDIGLPSSRSSTLP